MLIECIPNISEGRRPHVIDAIAERVLAVPGVRLLDRSSDPSHNRSVLTFAGTADGVCSAAPALVAAAIDRIDLRTHQGEHPRIGAVDVMPFVPLAGATMADCIVLARDVGAAVGSRFRLPVYLYADAAATPMRRNLEDIRRGQFEGLAAKMALPAWAPDFGPDVPHPSAGAIVIGARPPLIAYNVNLATDRLDVARQIARTVRASNGGLPHVKALGLTIGHRGIVQVSMNLTNFRETSMARAFERVQEEAARHGVSILDSEIVGLVPAEALEGTSAEALKLKDFTPDRILENRLYP